LAHFPSPPLSLLPPAKELQFQELTIVAWIFPEKAKDMCIISKGADINGRGFSLVIDQNRLQFLGGGEGIKLTDTVYT